MKVLHLLNSNRFSGAENVACQIIEMFREDTELEMRYCSPAGPIRKSLADRGIPFVPMERLSFREVKRVVKEQRPDMIHAHGFRASMIAAGSVKKIPVISHLHSSAPWMKKFGLRSFAYIATCMRYSAILTVSDSVFDKYVFGKYFHKKLHVMGNPVNVQNIRQKAQAYIEESAYDVGFCGRLSAPKNPLFFLDILYDIKKELPNVKVGIIGDGELRNKIEAKIIKSALSENIVLYSFVSNPYPIMKNFKILCMPSLWEGYPMVAVEALSLGVPVVCSAVGGLPEIVTDDGGKICALKEEYVQEIIKLLRDPQYRSQKSSGANRLAEKLGNVQEYRHRLHSIYTMSVIH